MATRISIVVSADIPQNTNVARFALDAAKIKGVLQFVNGQTVVEFVDGRDRLQLVYTDTSFDTIMDAIEQVDAENAVKLEIALGALQA